MGRFYEFVVYRINKRANTKAAVHPHHIAGGGVKESNSTRLPYRVKQISNRKFIIHKTGYQV